MRRATGLWTNRLRFYVVALVFAGAVLVFQHRMDKIAYQDAGIISSTSLGQTDAIPPWQEKALETYSAMSGLLTTLATALLGALGYLLINAHQGVPQLRHGASAMGSALLAVLSLYFGYVSHLTVLSSTYTNVFNPYAFGVMWPSRSQFYTLLLAVFFFADFAFHELGKEARSDRA
jgi:hypothetical protein